MMRRVKSPESTALSIPTPPLLVRRSANLMVSVPESDGSKESPRKLGGLVLTRHLGESIMVGDDVEVEVVGLRSGTVRLKIVAPKAVAVHRREVFDEIQTNARPPRFLPPEPAETSPATERPNSLRGGLVLTRSLHQSIMIGDEVELMVAEVRPGTVKLKIVAPRTVAVHRREVYDSIRSGEA